MYGDIDTHNSSPDTLEELRDELPNHIDNNLDLILPKLHSALEDVDYEIKPVAKESIIRGEQEDRNGGTVQDYSVRLMISVEEDWDDIKSAYADTQYAVAAATALDVIDFGWLKESKEWTVTIDFAKHCRRYN